MAPGPRPGRAGDPRLQQPAQADIAPGRAPALRPDPSVDPQAVAPHRIVLDRRGELGDELVAGVAKDVAVNRRADLRPGRVVHDHHGLVRQVPLGQAQTRVLAGRRMHTVVEVDAYGSVERLGGQDAERVPVPHRGPISHARVREGAGDPLLDPALRRELAEVLDPQPVGPRVQRQRARQRAPAVGPHLQVELAGREVADRHREHGQGVQRAHALDAGDERREPGVHGLLRPRLLEPIEQLGLEGPRVHAPPGAGDVSRPARSADLAESRAGRAV